VRGMVGLAAAREHELVPHPGFQPPPHRQMLADDRVEDGLDPVLGQGSGLVTGHAL